METISDHQQLIYTAVEKIKSQYPDEIIFFLELKAYNQLEELLAQTTHSEENVIIKFSHSLGMHCLVGGVLEYANMYNIIGFCAENEIPLITLNKKRRTKSTHHYYEAYFGFRNDNEPMDGRVNTFFDEQNEIINAKRSEIEDEEERKKKNLKITVGISFLLVVIYLSSIKIGTIPIVFIILGLGWLGYYFFLLVRTTIVKNKLVKEIDEIKKEHTIILSMQFGEFVLKEEELRSDGENEIEILTDDLYARTKINHFNSSIKNACFIVEFKDFKDAITVFLKIGLPNIKDYSLKWYSSMKIAIGCYWKDNENVELVCLVNEEEFAFEEELLSVVKESGGNVVYFQPSNKLFEDYLTQERVKEKITQICYAAHDERISILEQFVANGYTLNICNENENAPIHMATLSLKYKTAKFLLQNGTFVNVWNSDSYTPIHLAIKNGCSGKYLRLLLDAGGVVNVLDNEGNSPLHLAVLQPTSALALSTLLLDRGANINEKNIYGDTPLHLAGQKIGGERIGTLLINRGADKNGQNNDGEFPNTFWIHVDWPPYERDMELSDIETAPLLEIKNEFWCKIRIGLRIKDMGLDFTLIKGQKKYAKFAYNGDYLIFIQLDDENTENLFITKAHLYTGFRQLQSVGTNIPGIPIDVYRPIRER
jgi:ankyrin repeat protein